MSQDYSEITPGLPVPEYVPRPKPTIIPTAAWNDTPLSCLQVNDEWVSHILGVLTALDQPDTWIGTEEEIYAARQQVNEIMLALMPICVETPITGILDDFERDNADDLGANWTVDPINFANAGFSIVDGEAVGSANFVEAFWNVTPYGPGAYVFIQVLTDLVESQAIGCDLCLTNPNTSEASGYTFQMYRSTGVLYAYVFRIDSQSYAQIGFIENIILASGDWMKMEKNGDTLSVQTSTDGIIWTTIFSVDDTNYTSGFIGMYSESRNDTPPVHIGAFGGGTL